MALVGLKAFRPLGLKASGLKASISTPIDDDVELTPAASRCAAGSPAGPSLQRVERALPRSVLAGAWNALERDGLFRSCYE